MMVKAAHRLMQRIKQLIRSQAQDIGDDEESNEDKKVKEKEHFIDCILLNF